MRPAASSPRVRQRSVPQAWHRFLTPIGWVGVGWTEDGLAGVRMGYQTEAALNEAIGTASSDAIPTWVARLAERLRDYCGGAADDFQDIPLAALWSTEFQRAVVAALRAIPYGERTTYRDLAEKAGRPGASRAVGQVMATNPVPLVVPCHRVLASGGGLGGFSAPTGIELKRQLLDMESARLVQAAPGVPTSTKLPTATKRVG